MKKYSLQINMPIYIIILSIWAQLLPAQTLSVTCQNNFTVNLTPSNPAQVHFYASDFVQYTSTNNLIELGVRKSGTGTGFPIQANGDPMNDIIFTCDDIGVQKVEVWIRDQAGNTDFCESTFVIADYIGICQHTGDQICVHIATETGRDVEGVGVGGLGGYIGNGVPGQSMDPLTDAYGVLCVPYNPVWSANATITPTKESDALNGVDAYDLYLISQHILGINPFNSPYKLIAADANKSGSITSFDILEFQRLIQGVYSTALPNNSSWRFVAQNQVFSNPQNPFAEVIFENTIQGNIDHFPYYFEFIGIKIGDENNTVDANNQSVPPPSDSLVSGVTDRNFPPDIYYFDALNKTVAEGEVFTLEVNTNSDLLAWQFTLNLPHVEILSITPGTGLINENFGIFSAAVTSAVYTPSDHFSIQLKAKIAGTLSDWFLFNNDITTSAGFIENGEKVNIELRFKEEISGSPNIPEPSSVTLHANAPNPWHDATLIPFDLPEAMPVTFIIMDETGKVLVNQTGPYQKGRNAITIDHSLVAGSGVYFYSITTAKGRSIQKMIRF